MPSGFYADVVSTAVLNTFTHGQAITPSLADVPLGGEEFNNGDFEIGDLTGWTDVSGNWSVSSGALVHTTGAEGFLTQDVTPSVLGDVYLLEMQITGRNAGSAEIYDNVAMMDIYESTNGTFQLAKVITGTTTFTIYCTDDFDGRIEYVSLKRMDGYPANIYLNKIDGTPINEIRSANGGVYYGLYAGLRGQNPNNVGIGNSSLDSIVDESGNTAIGQSSGSGAKCNGGLFVGESAGNGETVDNQVHIGNNGDVISGTQAGGDPASQSLKFHAMIINMADIPTSSAGLNPGDVWNDSGVMKIA